MTINEMHILFRTIGQAMGLQLVRGILPESIDIYLNAAINEKCRSILLQNASTAFQDKITVRDNPVSPINALRTLYRTVDISITSSDFVPVNVLKQHIEKDLSTITNVFQFVSFYVGYNDGTVKNCRLIEHDKLQLVLNDYCNKADDEYPVVSLISDTNKDIIAKLYVENNSNVNLLTCNYICNPAKVQNNSNPIDCDLPEYLHNEIVELAVNKYFQSVGSTTQSVKQ